MLKKSIKKIINSFGYDIKHLPVEAHIRKQLDLLRQYQIDLIFDVGANTGQYAERLKKWGYKGRIVSFEPLPDAFKQLEKKAALHKNWEVCQTALGDKIGEATIHISKNSYSSSILEMLPEHLKSEPESVYIDKLGVPVKTIDSIINDYYSQKSNLFLKIDTQGFEYNVFNGCLNSLGLIKGFQMELSLVPLYQGEKLMHEMIELLKQYGYTLRLIEVGHMDYNTGELLQVECYFYR